MKIVTTLIALKEEIKAQKQGTIGYVPTMGFLHEGHLSLVDAAVKENDFVVMSIFVNPLQFGPNEDFDRYPRDEERDKQLAEEAGVDLIFMPQIEEMYPEEISMKLSVTKGVDVLCGQSRPGHFDGVVTVLTKLFHLIEPTNAYFGLKDAQQYAVVHQLVTQYNFPLTLIGLPTVREHDGLAKSSRNVYLTKEEREKATILYKSLSFGQQLVVDGTKNHATIKEAVKNYITTNSDATIDYVDVLPYPTLDRERETDKLIIAVAVQFDKARLIDNFIITNDGEKIVQLREGGL
ncbi:MAG TPA: pantoate--beta-alanine ligase [Pseudogracilibacillus sp.]|nr:pantoate--beta-alanine ligase [Pseudogracilibacillus sp.]